MTPLSQRPARDLAKRLADADATIAALLAGEIDAVVDSTSRSPVLLARAQQALRESEERYRLIVETTNEGVWLIDAEHDTIFMNGRMTAMLGRQSEPVIGCSLGAFLDDDQARTLIAHLAQRVRGLIEVRFTRGDGTSLATMVEASPVVAGDGHPPGWLVMVRDISEQKHAAKALKESVTALQQSEAFVRAAFLKSAVPGILVSVDGVVMHSNSAMSALLGYGDETLEGVAVTSFTAPDDRPMTDDLRERLLAGEVESAQMEKRYVRRDGTIIDVFISIALVPQTESMPPYFTTQIFDISDRKRAEREVREREALLAQIVQVQQAVAAADLDKPTIVDLIAERAKSLTGADGAEVAMLESGLLVYRAGSVLDRATQGKGLDPDTSLAGRCVRERQPMQSDDTRLDDRVHQGLADHVGARSALCVPLLHEETAVGVLTVYSSKVAAFQDRDVHTLQLIAGVGAAGLAHAAAFEVKQALIVERTAALVTLSEREVLIRSLIENAADPLITLDAHGVISYASPALERLLGRSINDFIGVRTAELFHPDDAPLISDTVAHMLASTRPVVAVEGRLLHRDGTWRTARVTGRNMLDDPAVRGLVVNLHDMTDEVVAAAQLRQSQKLEAVGQLAGGVAHDFNNLLTVISGHSEFLAADLGQLDARYADVQQIRLAADRAAALTAQLLAFSRQQVLQPTIVDMNAIVAGMQPMLRRLIGEDITLVTRPSADPVTVLADAGQLEQVVMNLAINGRDAMPNGGTLTIEVQLADLDATYPDKDDVVPGRYVMLAITDTGVGMTREVREHIFDPFFTTKELGKGTGLGLSTVYGIVKQSNGYISAYSEPGLWSAFKAYFPLAIGITEPVAVPQVIAATTGGSETVLLVEDEEAVRRLSKRILTRQGYRVLEARDGLDALDVVDRNGGRIDLLVTDMVMPRMNGRDLAERLSKRMPGLAVLFLSGYTNADILRREPDEPRIYHRLLQKPFTSEGLTTAVREALQATALSNSTTHEPSGDR